MMRRFLCFVCWCNKKSSNFSNFCLFKILFGCQKIVWNSNASQMCTFFCAINEIPRSIQVPLVMYRVTRYYQNGFLRQVEQWFSSLFAKFLGISRLKVFKFFSKCSMHQRCYESLENYQIFTYQKLGKNCRKALLKRW